jgi:hypothetical protein
MLVAWGIAYVDKYRVPIWVASSIRAHSLYESFRFQDVEVLEYDLERYGGLGSEKCICMLKPVEG